MTSHKSNGRDRPNPENVMTCMRHMLEKGLEQRLARIWILAVRDGIWIGKDEEVPMELDQLGVTSRTALAHAIEDVEEFYSLNCSHGPSGHTDN